MGFKTPLFNVHHACNAKIIEFGGWMMPLHYGSQIQEHHAVRQRVGLFDISHMARIDVTGPQNKHFLRYVLANDVARLRTGQALYSALLNLQGGILDDLIVYDRGTAGYRFVVNAATRAKDWAWLTTQAEPFEVKLQGRDDLAMIAVQGPQFLSALAAVYPDIAAQVAALMPFHFIEQSDKELFIARTGYTGEAGVEIMLPVEQAESVWNAFSAAGAQPCGLGARDTLRLEAGMNLYGHDMDETTTPLESNMAWTVAWTAPNQEQRLFIGRDALEQQRRHGITKQLIGVVLEGRGVLRSGQPVETVAGPGIITSGTFSPTWQRAIGFARVPSAAAPHTRCKIHMRQQWQSAWLVKPPFIRFGKVVASLPTDFG